MRIKKERNFESVHELQKVVRILNEAYDILGEERADPLRDKKYRLKGGLLGAIWGGGSVWGAVWGAEKSSSAYMLFNLQYGGGVIGVWMLEEVVVFLTPVAFTTGIGLLIGNHLQKDQLLKEEVKLLLKVQAAIAALEQMREEEELDGIEQDSQVETVIVLLKRALKEICEDIEML